MKPPKMNTKAKAVLNVILVAVISVALLFGMSAITDRLIRSQEDEAAKSAFSGLLDANRLDSLSTGDAEGITAAYRALDKDGGLMGYAVTVTVKGYGGDMVVHTALSADGQRFIGLRVGSHMETEGYGSKTAEPAFTDRFKDAEAPVSLAGYTGIEGLETPSPSSSPASPGTSSAPSTSSTPSSTAALRDGTYKAEQDGYVQGYRYFLELTVTDGKITAVNWDAYKENSDLTKKEESRAGDYVMTETGKKWHEQAEIMEEALIAAGDPADIVYSPDDGKTDAYAGVSISVGDFVDLAKRALEEARTAETMTRSASGSEIDGVTGATVSSKAVVKAANLAYVFVQGILS